MGVVMTVHDYRLACPTKHFLRRDGVCTLCRTGRFFHAASPRCAGLGGAALAAESYIQRLLNRYTRGVDVFLCPTEFMRDVLIDVGVPREKAIVLPNVIEPLAMPAEVPQSVCELLMAGRLSGEKAPHMMLDLAALLPTAHITLVGDGPLADEMRQVAAARSLANVELCGAVPHERLGAYIARATAVVLTSRWLENSPQIMLEAMRAGRCVIVPDHPPLREWVTDGMTGRTFIPGDSRDLARVAQQVLTDASAREAMAAAGRELVARRHDPGPILDRLEELYTESIARCGLR
jgi:glycosyltransferase involved in cell wall biosynthesis